MAQQGVTLYTCGCEPALSAFFAAKDFLIRCGANVGGFLSVCACIMHASRVYKRDSSFDGSTNPKPPPFPSCQTTTHQTTPHNKQKTKNSLAEMTSGMALRLESSVLLAEVIMGSAVEELALMRLHREVAREIQGGLDQVGGWVSVWVYVCVYGGVT
jgi:hypothetical protein